MTDLYLRTSIRQETEQKAFARGCKIAGASVLMVACSEFLMPLLEFESLGLWSWLVGSGATSVGLIPYQKLKISKRKPDILHADGQKLQLLHRNKPLFSISWQEVESFYYLDSGRTYGLAFTLKQPLKPASSQLSYLLSKSRREHGVDLFLPYFSHGSFLLLEQWYTQSLQDNVTTE